MSLESGSRVLRTEWIEAKGQETRYSFTASPEMSPNVYAHVTLLQPHAQTANDLPIRLYGVAPIRVVNPQTRLQPVLEVPEVLPPETTSTIAVREATGRPMTYTIAVVDEGLLGLTRFETPNPWNHFYAREALAVRTWDVYDDVLGAYGAAMERMLAIGGDEAGVSAKGRRANRFPPMVRFLGPFRLGAKATGTHKVEIPQYVGAVRVMVVAGRDAAFGATEKSAFVRRPLMLLATLPRVLGPEESVALPVSVFALEPKIKDVALSVTTQGPVEVVAEAQKTLTFSAVGDEVIAFRLRTKPGLGVASATVTATSGAEKASQKIELDVRSSTARVTDVLGGSLKPGEAWTPVIALPGLAGTNQATLEVSRVPPIDLGRRLEYLLAYPHGCLEQTVSAAFPQLFLGRLLELTPEKQARTQANVKAALERLRRFQATNGGFGYWPGDDDSADWATNYAGHFAIEAQKAGYLPPPGLLDQWTAFQRRRARAWVPGEGQAELTQAYRLFTLALVGAAELPAMNQLRERPSLPVAAKWRLAAAYQLAGQPEAARGLATGGPPSIEPYRELGFTYGSDLRDRAMVLEAVVLLGLAEHVGPLAKSVSESLSKKEWLSTHETAYALLALSKAVTDPTGDSRTAFSFEWNGAAATAVTSASPVVERRLEVGASAAAKLVVRNTGTTTLYPRLILSGLPPVGRETSASNGLVLDVQYLTPDDKPLDPSRLEQGTDLKLRVKVTNSGVRGDYQQLALSHVVASGWEIRNDRLDPSRARAASLRVPGRARRPRLYVLRPQGGRDEDGRARGERRLSGPLLPADGHGRGDVRRDDRRPRQGPMGRGRGSGALARAGTRGAVTKRRAVRWAGLAAAMLLAFWLFVPVVPFDDPLSTVVLDRDGGLVGASIAADGQWRFGVAAGVPSKFAAAITCFEDRRFYWHPGVDPIALGRAAVSNLRGGRVVSGGSTLTMQVVRLARKGRPRTFAEKAVEAVLALRLSLSLSKRQVLGLYAAYAPFGGNTVGLDAAAWRYFGRDAARLSWAETATLAVLPNAPSLVHPGRNRELLLAKRNRLLDRLRERGAIDALSADLAKREPLPPAPEPLPMLAPHLVARVRAERGVLRFRAGDESPWVRTTLSQSVQVRATEIVARHQRALAENGVQNAAVLVLDVATGDVLAYVGNHWPPGPSDHGEHVDVVPARRSTGSVLKPLLYASMLEAGEVLPAQLVADVPTHIGSFHPENFDRAYAGRRAGGAGARPLAERPGRAPAARARCRALRRGAAEAGPHDPGPARRPLRPRADPGRSRGHALGRDGRSTPVSRDRRSPPRPTRHAARSSSRRTAPSGGGRPPSRLRSGRPPAT